jgi:hypothetical protein
MVPVVNWSLIPSHAARVVYAQSIQKQLEGTDLLYEFSQSRISSPTTTRWITLKSTTGVQRGRQGTSESDQDTPV